MIHRRRVGSYRQQMGYKKQSRKGKEVGKRLRTECDLLQQQFDNDAAVRTPRSICNELTDLEHPRQSTEVTPKAI